MGNIPNSLGLGNKYKLPKEFEKYAIRPNGLYPTCPYEDKIVKNWIYEGKLAPRFPGADVKVSGAEECPICMLDYAGLNITKCCKKPMCTECFYKSNHQEGW